MAGEEIWETWNGLGGPKYPHELVVAHCFRSVPADQRATARVLDLGCGSGVNTLFLAREGFQTHAIDYSLTGVANARAKLEAEGLVADLRHGSAADLDYADAWFDQIVSIGVLDCMPADVADDAVAQASRVLKPGGGGLFLFAKDTDSRVLGDNTFGIRGVNRAAVEALFGERFETVYIDSRHVTFHGGRDVREDWLVTVVR